MKLSLLKNVSLLLIVLMIASSCGGGSTSQKEKNDASAEFDEAKSQIISGINQVIKDLPPPSEVPYLLMATGSDFDPTVTNNIDKVKEYLSPSSKAAINLGVYVTDVGYLSSYEKAQESLNYIGACQELAEALGIASAMDIKLISRFERNLSNKDSLKVLVDEVILNTNERLGALERMNIAGLVLAGTYVEGLYISTQLIKKYPNDLPEPTRSLILNPLIKIVIDQQSALEDLLTVLNDLSDDNDIAGVITELSKLKVIYETELAEVSKMIAENAGGATFSSDVINSLTEETAKIRATFVN